MDTEIITGIITAVGLIVILLWIYKQSKSHKVKKFKRYKKLKRYKKSIKK